VRTLHISNSEPAQKLAVQLVAGSEGGLRVLDIGCGSAVWSIAVAKADPKARITAFDYPKVLESTRQFVEREGVVGRAEYMAGDLRVAQFPERGYDLAILGNIVHGEDEPTSRDLFARIHRALDAGGRLAIIDMIPNDERTGPPFPLLFALNMLVNTDQGDTYTLTQYREWLTAAGFTHVETLDIGSHSPAIVATKP
jgi:ubiquinone/menaquinone biosynthesis C-methylase UbiE